MPSTTTSAIPPNLLSVPPTSSSPSYPKPSSDYDNIVIEDYEHAILEPCCGTGSIIKSRAESKREKDAEEEGDGVYGKKGGLGWFVTGLFLVSTRFLMCHQHSRICRSLTWLAAVWLLCPSL